MWDARGARAEVVAQAGGEWPANKTAARVYTYYFITPCNSVVSLSVSSLLTTSFSWLLAAGARPHSRVAARTAYGLKTTLVNLAWHKSAIGENTTFEPQVAVKFLPQVPIQSNVRPTSRTLEQRS